MWSTKSDNVEETERKAQQQRLWVHADLPFCSYTACVYPPECSAEREACLHDSSHKDIVLKGVGIAGWIFVEHLQQIGASIAAALPFCNGLLNHLHMRSASGTFAIYAA